MYLFEKISNNFAAKLATILNFDEDRKEIIAYGAFNLIQTLWSTLVIAIFGIVFNTLMSILIIAFTVALLRKFSGGAHATSPNRCALISVIAFGTFSLLVNYGTPLSNVTLVTLYAIASFIFTYITLYKYCPVDTPNKPIRRLETRLKFRKASFRVIFFLICITMLLLIFFTKTHKPILLTIIASISSGIIWQSITMTHVGHLVINKLDSFMQNIKFAKGGKKHEKKDSYDNICN